MKVERIVRSGQIARQACDAVERLRLRGGPAHPLQHSRACVLKRDVEIRQDLALRHQRDHGIDVRVGVDVMQPHPDAEFAERRRQIEKARVDLAPAPRARGVFDVETVGRRILRDDEQLLYAGGGEALGFAQHVGGGP